MDEGRLSNVLALGIAESRAKEIVKKDAAYASLMEVVRLAGLAQGATRPKAEGALLYELSSTFPKAGSKGSLESVARAIAEGKLDSKDRLAVALAASEEKGPAGAVSAQELVERCLFGVAYSDDHVRKAAEEAVAGDEASWEGVGKLLELARRKVPFCEGGRVKQAVDAALTAKIGAAKPKEKKGDSKKAPVAAAAVAGEGGEGNKKKKTVAEVKPLPAIDVRMSNTALAEHLRDIALEVGSDKTHAVQMIADVRRVSFHSLFSFCSDLFALQTLAALRRDSYAQGLASAGVDSRNGVRLPNVPVPNQ